MALFSVSPHRFEIFGYSFERKGSENLDQRQSVPDTFAPPSNLDGATITGGMSGYYVNFNEEVQNEALLVQRYRDAAQNPEFEKAIDDVINEAISFDDGTDPIKLDLNAVEIPEGIRDKLHKEFADVLRMMDFKHNGLEIFKRWYVDGRIYFHKVVDQEKSSEGIHELRYIHPGKIKLIREELTDQHTTMIQGQRVADRRYIEYFLYNDMGFADSTVTGGIRVATDSIAFCHSGLQDSASDVVISYLHKALRPFNQLRMMEDAVVIAKFTRAPQRRAFYVDVGQLPRHKADQYMNETIRQHRNKVSYDSKNGEFRSERRTASMIEDYWFPKRGSERSTEIDTLTGDNAFADMTDVDYFRKKLYEALNVPVSRLESNSMFNLGRSSEIARDEVKFQKFVDHLRNRFNFLFIDILRTQVVLKNLMSLEDFDEIAYNIDFVYGKDSAYAEFRDQEILRERINLASQLEIPMHTMYSRTWARKNILKMTDDEIKQMDSEIEDEKDDTNDMINTSMITNPNLMDDPYADKGLEKKKPADNPFTKKKPNGKATQSNDPFGGK
jgi:hypothetical protein